MFCYKFVALQSKEITPKAPEKFHTGDVFYRNPCSVSDWPFSQ